MTIVKGIIADSAGNPLSGNLIVTLAGAVFNKSTTPNTVYIPEPRTFTITNGVVNINLPESETSKVSYRFEFFVTTSGVTATTQNAPFPFNAVVPNIAEVELDDLAPTGMTSDVLDTGVLRLARLIASDPAYSAALSGINPKGNWVSNVLYKNGDMVTYNDRLYICRSLSPITGTIPFDGSAVWMVIPTSTTGIVTLGSNTPYGSSWSSSDLAAGQSALFNVLETKANLASPTFTGNVIVPTVATSDNSTAVASTAYVKNNLTLYATLASPGFTGTPTAPTAAAGTNNTQVATTAFVQGLLTSPNFTGVPTAPTAAAGTNTTQIATTQFVQGLLASPTFTGDPKAPTPSWGNNSTSLATTAFVVSERTPRVRASRTGNQALSNNTDTIATYQTELDDTDNAFNPATGVFTVPTGRGGLYLVTFNATGTFSVTSTAFSSWTGDILYAGNVIRCFLIPSYNSGSYTSGASGSAVVSVSAGQTIQTRVNGRHDGTVTSINLTNAEISIVRIG